MLVSRLLPVLTLFVTCRETLSLTGSCAGQATERAAALAVLSLLPAGQLAGLECELENLSRWTGELSQTGLRWQLAVKPPANQGVRKSFIIEKRQLRDLGLDTNSSKLFKSSQ